jgi:hypothetical protein
MASTTATTTMVKAVLVAVLLVQCCDVMIVAARPLLHVTAGPDTRTTMMTMQVLDKSNGPRRPGGGNQCFQIGRLIVINHD